MKKLLIKFKKPLIFALVLIPIAIVAGFFTAIYSWQELTEEARTQILEQVGNVNLFYLVTVIQTILYAVIFGSFGYILSDKLGLMKSVKIEKKPLLVTGGLAVFTGLVISSDIFLFRHHISQVASMYASKPSFEYWMSSVLYGGIIEEVMLRLFVMSLIAFVAWKLFFRKQDKAPVGVLITANIIAALLFAAGHLPATVQLFGEITPLILFRCFLLNGAGGLVFGYLYRKYGIHYSMMAHAGAHIVWKLIWVLM